jgi:hypothetical protein
MAVRQSSASVSRRWINCGLAALLLFVSARAAAACQLCYEAARQSVTIGQRLDSADRVVLAVPLAGANQFRMVEVVKGKDAVGDIIADPVTGLDVGAVPGRDPYLLVRDPLASQWTSLGTIRAEYADWLRQLVATSLVKGDRPRPTWPSNMQTSFTLSYAGWRQRFALVLPYLLCPAIIQPFDGVRPPDWRGVSLSGAARSATLLGSVIGRQTPKNAIAPLEINPVTAATTNPIVNLLA